MYRPTQLLAQVDNSNVFREVSSKRGMDSRDEMRTARDRQRFDAVGFSQRAPMRREVVSGADQVKAQNLDVSTYRPSNLKDLAANTRRENQKARAENMNINIPNEPFGQRQ